MNDYKDEDYIKRMEKRIKDYATLHKQLVEEEELNHKNKIIRKEKFVEKVEKWATKIGVEYKEIQFQHMKNKWSSCTAEGRIAFDPDILDKDDKFQSETIVYTLLQFRDPNLQGIMFKQMIDTYLKNDSDV